MYTSSLILRGALIRDYAIRFVIIHLCGFRIPSVDTFSHNSSEDHTGNTCRITYVNTERTRGVSLANAGAPGEKTFENRGFRSKNAIFEDELRKNNPKK